jgi:hypothetical protein
MPIGIKAAGDGQISRKCLGTDFGAVILVGRKVKRGALSSHCGSALKLCVGWAEIGGRYDPAIERNTMPIAANFSARFQPCEI